MSKKFLESGVHVSSNREFVETLYKNWAETYDQEIEKNLYSTPNRIASILAQTESNKGIKVLDYGCGTGLSGLALKKVGFRNLVGIDPSDEMLQKAEEKKIYKSLKWGGGLILYEKVRGSDARFQDMLNHLLNLEKLDNGFLPQEIFSKSVSLAGKMEPFSDFGNRQILESVGFKDIEIVFKHINFQGYLCIK